MKKRNLVIVAFMLVAAMTIGVGYAILTVQLTVNGSASVSAEAAAEEFKKDVYFSNAAIVNTTGTRVKDASGATITDTITIDDLHTVTFQANTLMGIGECVEYTITVRNDSTLPAAVAPTITITENTSDAYEVVVTQITNGNPLATATTDGNSFELAAGGGEQTFNVIIKLKTMPTEESEIFKLALKINLNAQIDN